MSRQSARSWNLLNTDPLFPWVFSGAYKPQADLAPWRFRKEQRIAKTFGSLFWILPTRRLRLCSIAEHLGQMPHLTHRNPILPDFLWPQDLQFGTTSYNHSQTAFLHATARPGPVTGSTTTAMTRSPSEPRSATTSAGFRPRSLVPFRIRHQYNRLNGLPCPPNGSERSLQLPEAICS